VGSPERRHRRGPRRDEDADYVLRELLGYDTSHIERLTGQAGAELPSEDPDDPA
jgi:hypothetical protein